MKFIFTTLKKTLFWSYDRGSWQYDLMVLAILVFGFEAPTRFFPNRDKPGPEGSCDVIRGDDLGTVAPAELEGALSRRLSRKLGHPVKILRVDQAQDESGKVIYIVHHQ